MNTHQCQGKVVGPDPTPRPTIRIMCCPRHSIVASGVGVWGWSVRPLPRTPCPCEGGDRFIAVTEEAPTRWVQSADVLMCAAQPSVRGALGASGTWLRSLPGCALVAVPTGRYGTVFRTRAEQIVDPPGVGDPWLRAAWAYAWTVAGHRLGDLTGPDAPHRLLAASSQDGFPPGSTRPAPVSGSAPPPL